MITVVKSDGSRGITVGQRKDGSRAVMWDDNSIQWFTAAEFSSIQGESA